MPQLKVNGIQVHFDSRGEGPPVVLIHGLGSNGKDWDPQTSVFSRQYRVITVDLRGHGRSAKPAGPYTVQLLSDDVAAVIRRLGVEGAHIVALSLGGALAFQLMLDYPYLVKSAVIVNSGPQLVLNRFALWQRRLLIRLFGLPYFGRVLGKRLFPDPALSDERLRFEESFKANETRPYLAALNALARWNVWDQLASIEAPILVVAADQDYTPVSFKQAYVDKLPNARLAVVPDSRHALPAERPEAFNRLVLDFLAQHA
ncbi:MAG: alpha/beta fold hydrolase [Nevskia sp.]|nr:alpha/beta fold hydrolase [Nevskia sp.]